MSDTREPILHLPRTVSILIGVFVLVHVVRLYVFSFEQDVEFLATFAFVPARFSVEGALEHFPGGWTTAVLSTVTYALIHGDWGHLIVNSVWLAAFGSAVERRFGGVRFLAFSAVCAVAAVGAHYIAFDDDLVPIVGASGAVSGHMAASMRFVFATGGPLGSLRRHDREVFRLPAMPLSALVTDKRVLVFTAVFFAINLLIGATGGPFVDDGTLIAWQAHIGGFLAGLVAFALFDPIGSGRPPEERREPPAASEG